MSERIINEKVEFTPTGIKITWVAVRERECWAGISVVDEGRRVVLKHSDDGACFPIEKEFAEHIGKLLIAFGNKSDV